MQVCRTWIVATSIVLLSPPVRADDKSDAARAEIQNHYNAVKRTFRGANVGELKIFLASKLLKQSKDQTVKSTDQSARSENQPTDPPVRVLRNALRTKVDSIVVREDVAKVVVILDVSAVIQTDNGPSREDSRGALEDSWKFNGTKWELTETKTSRLEQMARTCRANLAAMCSACAAHALRHNTYPDKLEALVGAPEGLSELPNCPLDHKPYHLLPNSPQPNAVTLICPNAAEHGKVMLVTHFNKTLAPPARQ